MMETERKGEVYEAVPKNEVWEANLDKLRTLDSQLDEACGLPDEIGENEGVGTVEVQDVPRSLEKTEQGWTTDEAGESQTYNSPLETGEKLDADQGDVPGYEGTCGLVSCVNVLRLAGLDIKEQEMVLYALDKGLCRVASDYGNGGGTNPESRQTLLKEYGVESTLERPTIDNIKNFVSEGRGVIISVDAGKLWGQSSAIGYGHAVTVTSVVLDTKGNSLGFYICDSGTGGQDSAKFYLAQQITDSLSGRPMNVTTAIIR